MIGATRIQLPNGVWRAGSRHVDAFVRPLTGEDEEFLLDEAVADLPPARRATALLARCVVRLGPVEPVTEDDVRALPAGDREALLLEVRRLTFGDRIQSTVACPACGERLDLDFRAADVRVPPRPDGAESYEAHLPADSAGGGYRVRFRLPTGSDQEAAVAAAVDGVDAGVRVLVARCVQESTRDRAAVAPDDLPPSVVDALSKRMAESDPQAEVELASRCPSCGHEFRSLLDAGRFLFDEVSLRLPNLYREVHALALHYHWGEREILRMTARKRQRYLDLLRDSLAEQETG